LGCNAGTLYNYSRLLYNYYILQAVERRNTVETVKHIKARRAARIRRKERRVRADATHHEKMEMYREKATTVIADSEISHYKKKKLSDVDRYICQFCNVIFLY
jgi:hypothetical protein